MMKRKAIKLKPGVILLGFAAMVTQIIVLREFLTFFNGNELVIGIILANWMLLTAFGAYLGRYISKLSKSISWIYALLGSLAFLPVISIILLHTLWHLYFPAGILAGIGHIFYYSLIILSPFCIVSGILFTLFAKEESVRSEKNKIGNVYAWESIGSLIGGALLNFVIIWLLPTFQGLFVIMVLIIVVAVILGFKARQLFTSGILIFVFLMLGFLFLENNIDKKIRGKSFPGQKIIYTSDSPFGTFIIAEHDGQINYYENNVLMSSSGDIILKEESAHVGMIQHHNPKNVLILSGIISGITDEVIKYPVNSIDYVDINPEIVKFAKFKLNSNLNSSKLKLVEGDAFRFLKRNKKKYDVVLINLPHPSTLQLNRYFTLEFFHLLKASLNKDAVISLSVSSSANYLSNETKNLLSIIYKTLKSAFDNVIILPLTEDFLLASGGNLTHEIAESIEKRGILTEYVNTFYINDELLKMRSRQLTDQLDAEVPLNKNFSPVFYQSQIKLWMSHFKMGYWLPALFIIAFSGFFFIRAGNAYKGVFAAGFAGTSIEIQLILVFQLVFGYVYSVVGIFIMIFMGGLAYGSYRIPGYFKNINAKLFSKLQVGVSLFAFMLPVLFSLTKNARIHDLILVILFAILTFTISSLTGAIFSVASTIAEKRGYEIVASGTYSLDLLGAATGALLFTIYLIPLLGYGWSVAAIGAFNLLLAGIKK